MPRRKATAAAPPPANGKPRGRVDVQPPDVQKRIRELTAREKANRLLAGSTVRLYLKIPLMRKEAFMDLAERHNEELSVVMRACLEHGYAHFSRFAAVTDGPSPFIAGMMAARTQDWAYGKPPQHVVDPTGGGWPPAPMPRSAFGQTAIPQDRPTSTVWSAGGGLRETFRDETDTVFADPSRTMVPVGNRRVPMAAILPSSGPGDPVPLPEEPAPPAEAPPQAQIDEFPADGGEPMRLGFGDAGQEEEPHS